MGIVATMLMLGTALSPAPEESGDIAFVIQIQKDASISISSLNTYNRTNTSQYGVPLEFEPSINSISEDEYALPKNVNLSDVNGSHWNITNVGNIDSYIYLQINGSVPQGISIQVGSEKDYTSNKYLDITNNTQKWIFNTTSIIDGAPLGKLALVGFWERIAADATALGGNSASLKIAITSFPEAQ